MLSSSYGYQKSEKHEVDAEHEHSGEVGIEIHTEAEDGSD
jgi:hypothetical protein